MPRRLPGVLESRSPTLSDRVHRAFPLEKYLMTPVSDPVFLEVSKVQLGVHPVCAISEYVES